MQGEIQPAQTRDQNRSRQNIAVRKETFAITSDRWVTFRARSRANRATLKALLDSHPEFLDPRTIGFLVIVLAALPGVYGLDSFLISSAAQFSAITQFAGLPVMVFLTLILTPAAMLGVELYLAVKLFAAREELADGDPRAARTVRLCLAAGIGWSVVIAVTVLASNLAAGSESRLPAPNLTLALAMTGVALIIHILVLVGGRSLHDAAGYVVFVVHRIGYSLKIRRAENGEVKQRRALVQILPNHLHALLLHEKRYGDRLMPGPFSAAERQAIEELFDPGVIPPDTEVHQGLPPTGPMLPPASTRKVTLLPEATVDRERLGRNGHRHRSTRSGRKATGGLSNAR